MDIIPDLPNEIALECLSRVSYKQFATILSVCKGWKSEISLPEFRRNRKNTRRCEQLLVMNQARVEQGRKSDVLKRFTNPIYRVTVLELGSGYWSDLPQIPGFSDGLPLFCQLSAVGSYLVVMGGLDLATWEVLRSVYVYNFVSSSWRRGTDIPGVRRMFFGCASDDERMVYVAGGHDENKNALKSSMTYEVERNEWVPLPDMSKERDECQGFFHDGKFVVIGGYSTNTQGRFERHAETFDVAMCQWDPVEEGFLESATCPRTCTYGDNDDLYMCHEGDVMEKKCNTWQAVAKLPAEVCNVAHVTTWQGKFLVIGSAGFDEPH